MRLSLQSSAVKKAIESVSKKQSPKTTPKAPKESKKAAKSQNSNFNSNSSNQKKNVSNKQNNNQIENAPKSEVLALYKALLKRSREFQFTNKEFFARRMHQEFMKRKDVKDNNLYYIRGKWMLENKMGGLL